jgi:uncharacterized protein YraI
MEMKMTGSVTSRPATVRRWLAGLFSVLALVPALAPAPAQAQAQAVTGFTTSSVVLRAGPSVAYPHVLVIPGGAPVTVYGCVAGWTWCDVSYQDARGWVTGTYLSSSYQGARVPLPGFAARLGLPILGFAFNDYWGRYYRDRPWFNQRSHWAPRDHGHYPPPHGPHRPPHHGPNRPPHHGQDRPGHAPNRPPQKPDRPAHGSGQQHRPGPAATRPNAQ